MRYTNSAGVSTFRSITVSNDPSGSTASRCPCGVKTVVAVKNPRRLFLYAQKNSSPPSMVVDRSPSNGRGTVHGDRTNTTFNSQITCVLQLPGTGQYIAMADRWKPEWWVPHLSRQIISGMERHFKGYTPDLSPKSAVPLPGKEQKNIENTYRSRYVWLPVEWDGEKPTIRLRSEWQTM